MLIFVLWVQIILPWMPPWNGHLEVFFTMSVEHKNLGLAQLFGSNSTFVNMKAPSKVYGCHLDA